MALLGVISYAAIKRFLVDKQNVVIQQVRLLKLSMEDLEKRYTLAHQLSDLTNVLR